jgi:uncharacterized membrane protein
VAESGGSDVSASNVQPDLGTAPTTLLTACVFDTADGADEAVRRMVSASDPLCDLVDDAVTLRWDESATRPRLERRVEMASRNVLGDDFWALVIGLTFRVPLLGAAVGGAAGARSGSLAVAGIDEIFMNRLRDLITPRRSALLAIGPRSASDLVADHLAGPQRPDSVVTRISDRQTAALREVFAS